MKKFNPDKTPPSAELLQKLIFITALVLFSCGLSCAQEEYPECEGITNADEINVRSDSTISSESVCRVDKNSRVSIVGESYEWYKVRLPRGAPAYIKKDLVAIDPQRQDVGSITKDNVNIRLRPDISAPIVGRVRFKDQVRIVDQVQDWYRVEPTRNSFGWVHKGFIARVKAKDTAKTQGQQEATKEGAPAQGGAYELITAEGTLKPKTMTSVATHKLIQTMVSGATVVKSLYLLKSRNINLDEYNNRKIKLTGKVYNPAAKNPVIEIDTIEEIN